MLYPVEKAELETFVSQLGRTVDMAQRWIIDDIDMLARVELGRLDFTLNLFRTQLTVIPVTLSLAMVRTTFPLRDHLEFWRPFRDALWRAVLTIKKPEPAAKLMTGLWPPPEIPPWEHNTTEVKDRLNTIAQKVKAKLGRPAGTYEYHEELGHFTVKLYEPK